MTSRSERAKREQNSTKALLKASRDKQIYERVAASAAALSRLNLNDQDADLIAIWTDNNGNTIRHTLSQHADSARLLRELHDTGANLSTVRYERQHVIQEEP